MRGRKGAFSFNLYSARLGSLLALGLSGRSVSSGSLGGLLGILHVRGPEGKVVTEELHDEGRVLVALLGEGVELGDGVVEGLLGEVASAVGAVQDLVVEDREVEGKTQADGVGGGQLGDGNVRSSLVSLERLVGGVLALVASGELGEVSVVVTLPVALRKTGVEAMNPEKKVSIPGLTVIQVRECSTSKILERIYQVAAGPVRERKRTSCGRRPCSRPKRPRG